MMTGKWLLVPALLAILAGCSGSNDNSASKADEGAAPAGSYVDKSTDLVTQERLINADKEPGNWMTNGRSYNETYFSPLKLINDQNVKQLGLAWIFDLDTHRGQEATPLIVNGVMYVATAWSKLKALNAKTGELLWEFDPHVPPEDAARTCCDAVNRGAALWKDKVYIGTLDGRLIALNAKTGKVVWSVRTFKEGEHYNITGAPRVGGGKVFIGQGGGDSGSRGFASAYDAETGKLIWRFYITPGNPADGFENKAMERAAKTWTGEWWKNGTGGTPWNSFAYDPDLNMLYIGAGNAGPWDKSIRSPKGGDNLYVASIIAVNADTGEYIWHFQATPGDSWDFTNVQPMILTDLTIDGVKHKVLMQAPKNGYFYVLDRVTGQFLSGTGIVPINWSLGLDKNGRPLINPEAEYWKTRRPFVSYPGIGGAHNWQPMSYDKNTGLVYIPVMESPTVHRPRMQLEGAKSDDGNNVYAKGNPAFLMDGDSKIRMQILKAQAGHLLAWDPVKKQEIWRVTMPAPFNGGVLSTAGNLVFEGGGNGQFAAYSADHGQLLWHLDTYGGIIAAPATYTVDGEQYVAVLQGWGGGFAMGAGAEANMSGPKRNIPRVLAFKLGGKEVLPEPPPWPELTPPPLNATKEQVAQGGALFNANCARCHGGNAISGGTIPDVRYSSYLKNDTWFDIVLGGALKANGMIPFDKTLTHDQAQLIRDYAISRAHDALNARKAEN